MKLEVIAAQSDEALATLYSLWSEETYCAGWIGNGAAEFIEAMLAEEDRAGRGFSDYERETISEVRRLVSERLALEEPTDAD